MKILMHQQYAKLRKLVKNIGVSIYDEFEIYGLPLDDINIIQIPLSLYNQNVLSRNMINSLNEEISSLKRKLLFSNFIS